MHNIPKGFNLISDDELNAYKNITKVFNNLSDKYPWVLSVEGQPKAKLIAAAPELLAALEMAQRWFECNFHRADNGQNYFDIAMVEMAIEKAKQ